MSRYSQKTLDCLRLAAMRVGSEGRNDFWWELAGRYSEKAVVAKLEQLAKRGLVDYGVAPHYGWLTDEGRAALQVPPPTEVVEGEGMRR